MKDVEEVDFSFSDFILDTGSPHYVKNVADVGILDVVKEGREIRYSKEFCR